MKPVERMTDEEIKAAWSALRSMMEKAGTLPKRAPKDPKARALWLREHRNTGPAKDQYEHKGQR